MSYDAGTWAAAQAMPFTSARQRARAKAVLKCLASYADVKGRSWVTMNVFIVETDLGGERTVQRGLADLKAAGIIEDTGEREVYFGRCYPIYQLHMDRGPQNTRERLRGRVDDVAEAPGDGVTELSPQPAWGDSPDAPRGDTSDALGVTAVTPNEEDNPHFVREDNHSARAREAGFGRLVEASPRRVLRYADLDAARQAWEALAAAGEDLERIVEAARFMAGHADFASRKHPPQLHDWLVKGMWRGWLPEPELPLDVPQPPADAIGGGDPRVEALKAAARPHVEDGAFASYLSRLRLVEAGGVAWLVAWSVAAVEFIRDRCLRRMEGAWRAAGGTAPLTLITRQDFEARMRQSERAA